MRGRYLSRQLSLSFVERYGDIVSYFNPPSKEKLLSPELKAELPPDSRYSLLCRLNDQLSANSPAITHLQYMDLMTYLPNDILVKVDRTSMLNSLETRVPLLDHKLVEFVASLPANYRMRGYEQKYILKQAMRDLLPQETMTRRKMGFVVPLVHWFRNELWDYSRELLLSRRAASRGFFSQAYISELLNRHKNGEGDFSWRIWALLFFEEWCRQFLDAPVPAVSGE
jgi:asparagine synthase (glutamine-hydrolysing)